MTQTFKINIVFTLVVLLLLLSFTFSSKETFEPTKNITTIHNCKSCKSIWNHLDANSKCSMLCQVVLPDSNSTFNGYWKNEKDGTTSCGCDHNGTITKHFVGCPTPSSLNYIKNDGVKDDCFFFTKDDAEKSCPLMCDNYIPGYNSKWTGNWKNTSTHTSACECQYYK